MMAAVLAFGDGAVLSHRSAGERSAVLPPTASNAHVTTAQRSFHGKPGIRLHRVRSLPPDGVTEIDGIPVTTLPRVLLDLAAPRDTTLLKRAWNESQRRGLLDVAQVEWICDNSPGRRTKPLRALIADTRDAPATRSELEERFADLIDRHPEIPAPAFIALVEDHLVDALWADSKVIVELDGRAYHWSDAAFEHDRQRDNDLQLAGYRILRITWKRLTGEPVAVIAQLRRALV
jgi:hypothetical protein